MRNVSHKKIEKTAKEAALKAAKIQLRYHNKQTFEISFKGDVNLVTDADIKSEAAVIQTIKKAFPTHAILSEENNNSHKESLEGPVWIIDPLDGTTNFSHGFPHFAISIAYRENNQTQFGLVYQPVTKEMFMAHIGRGATLNGKKISVSKTPNVNRSLIGTGFPYDRRESELNNISEFCTVEMNCQDLRRPGAATLDLAYVACGRFDGYWEHKLSAWDVAAGALLVTEAGGLITDYQNKPQTNLWNAQMVATNGLIHDPLLKLLNRALKKKIPSKDFI